jgi:tol-pal system protein YbgF
LLVLAVARSGFFFRSFRLFPTILKKSKAKPMTKTSKKIVASLLLVLSLGVTPAFAASKEMIQLQTQIQQLQEAVARLQQSNDERMGVLKDLVQQSADSVNRMSLNMDALQKQMRTQQEAQGTKLDQVSTQVQALNDSLDEMKARISHLDKAMADLSNQQQAISSTLQSLPSAGGQPQTAAPAATPAPVDPTPAPVPVTRPGRGNKQPPAVTPLGDDSAAAPAPAAPAANPNAPPVGDMYKLALGDYMAAKYPLASAEFADVIRAYPDTPQAGNAHYYMGEIDYRQGKYTAAEKDYDAVIEQFPGNAKIPAAQLHKGQALIVQKQTDAGVREFRSLIARYPNSPEAAQARSKLNAMGVKRSEN